MISSGLASVFSSWRRTTFLLWSVTARSLGAETGKHQSWVLTELNHSTALRMPISKYTTHANLNKTGGSRAHSISYRHIPSRSTPGSWSKLKEGGVHCQRCYLSVSLLTLQRFTSPSSRDGTVMFSMMCAPWESTWTTTGLPYITFSVNSSCMSRKYTCVVNFKHLNHAVTASTLKDLKHWLKYSSWVNLLSYFPPLETS